MLETSVNTYFLDFHLTAPFCVIFSYLSPSIPPALVCERLAVAQTERKAISLEAWEMQSWQIPSSDSDAR